jgi:hypothetical protein
MPKGGAGEGTFLRRVCLTGVCIINSQYPERHPELMPRIRSSPYALGETWAAFPTRLAPRAGLSVVLWQLGLRDVAAGRAFPVRVGGARPRSEDWGDEP